MTVSAWARVDIYTYYDKMMTRKATGRASFLRCRLVRKTIRNQFITKPESHMNHSRDGRGQSNVLLWGVFLHCTTYPIGCQPLPLHCYYCTARWRWRLVSETRGTPAFISCTNAYEQLHNSTDYDPLYLVTGILISVLGNAKVDWLTRLGLGTHDLH